MGYLLKNTSIFPKKRQGPPPKRRAFFDSFFYLSEPSESTQKLCPQKARKKARNTSVKRIIPMILISLISIKWKWRGSHPGQPRHHLVYLILIIFYSLSLPPVRGSLFPRFFLILLVPLFKGSSSMTKLTGFHFIFRSYVSDGLRSRIFPIKSEATFLVRSPMTAATIK